MSPGQVAVHLSRQIGHSPSCTVCDSRAEAEACAQQHLLRDPSLRCRLYDHHGFVGAPLLELTGPQFKGERELTPRIRRWTGSLMLGIGLLLCALDWSTDFRLNWPGLIGSRLLIPGALLLITEGLILLNARQKAWERRKAKSTP